MSNEKIDISTSSPDISFDEFGGYEFDNCQENVSDYCVGGYHPAKIGDFYNERYHVIRKIGWGQHATVWLCWDSNNSDFVAIKIIKSNKYYSAAASRELTFYKRARDANSERRHANNTVKILDDFQIKGRYGIHICLVFEMVGDDLLTFILSRNSGGISLKLIKSIIKQILQGMHYLHNRCKIIHTDLKLENVLVYKDKKKIKEIAVQALERKIMGFPQPFECVANVSLDRDDRFDNDEQVKDIKKLILSIVKSSDTNESYVSNRIIKQQKEVSVKIGDLGNSCWVHDHLDDLIQSRQYRSPEIILGIPYDETADIWSVGCIAFILVSGMFLFDPQARETSSVDEEHLAAFIGVLGPIPQYLIEKGKNSQNYFFQDGTLKNIKEIENFDLAATLVTNCHWEREDANEFVDFLLPMLEYDPEKRTRAAVCLEHPFLKD